MEYQEAIDILIGLQCGWRSKDNDAIDMAINALKKQSPKKPICGHYEVKGEPLYIKWSCPNECGIGLSPVTEKYNAHENVYCNKCGQKIDWNDYE